MRVIRATWVGLNALVGTLVLGTLAILLPLVGLRGRTWERLSHYWCRWMLAIASTPVYVQGMQHVALDRPQIIVSNHASWFDILALGAVLPKHFRFVGKKELDRIPFFGWAWRAAGHVSIDRSNRAAAIQSLRTAERLMKSNNSVVIMFAEGTRTRTGELQAFKKGAFMLSLGTGVDIVPAAIVGSRDVLRKGDWRVHPSPIIVRFGEPVSPAAYSETRRDAYVGDVRARVQALLENELPATAGSATAHRASP